MSQGWQAKLIDKSKSNHVKRHGNTCKGVIARRLPSTFAERKVAFENYKRTMHGFREGNFVNEGGVRWVGRDGTGIPDEGYDGNEYYAAVVYPRDQPKVTPRAKVTSKVAVVVSAPVAAQVAKWSRRGGFAAK